MLLNRVTFKSKAMVVKYTHRVSYIHLRREFTFESFFKNITNRFINSLLSIFVKTLHQICDLSEHYNCYLFCINIGSHIDK